MHRCEIFRHQSFEYGTQQKHPEELHAPRAKLLIHAIVLRLSYVFINVPRVW